MDKTIFVMTVGIPYSGKSSFINTLNYDVVSSDAIRAELYGDESIQKNPKKIFDIVHNRILNNLSKNVNTVFDATNINRKRRESFLRQVMKVNKDIYKVCLYFSIDHSTLDHRMTQRERIVPLEVVQRMESQLEIPVLEEGWDLIVNKDVCLIDNSTKIMYNINRKNK